MLALSPDTNACARPWLIAAGHLGILSLQCSWSWAALPAYATSTLRVPIYSCQKHCVVLSLLHTLSSIVWNCLGDHNQSWFTDQSLQDMCRRVGSYIAGARLTWHTCCAVLDGGLCLIIGQHCNASMMCFALHDLLESAHCKPNVSHPPVHDSTAPGKQSKEPRLFCSMHTAARCSESGVSLEFGSTRNAVRKPGQRPGICSSNAL